MTISQNININEIAEALNNKVDLKNNCSQSDVKYIVETYSSGTNWYRVWSDGWIEQGGKTPSVGNDISITVTLNKAFSNTNYYINLTSNTTTTTFNSAQPNWVNSRTTTNFSAHIDCYGADGSDWYACGY